MPPNVLSYKYNFRNLQDSFFFPAEDRVFQSAKLMIRLKANYKQIDQSLGSPVNYFYLHVCYILYKPVTLKAENCQNLYKC